MDATGEFQTFTGTLAFSHDPEKLIIQVPGVESFKKLKCLGVVSI